MASSSSILELNITKNLLHHFRVDAQPMALLRFPSKEWLFSKYKDVDESNVAVEDLKGNGGFISFIKWWIFGKATQVAEYYYSDVSLEEFAKTKAGDAIVKKKVVPALQGN